MSVLKSIGAKNIRLENDRGWFNQPEVVVFNGDKNKAQDALNEAFDTDYIRVSEKDWRTKKMADGGFTPDVSDGTQFMSGVYAQGGEISIYNFHYFHLFYYKSSLVYAKSDHSSPISNLFFITYI